MPICGPCSTRPIGAEADRLLELMVVKYAPVSKKFAAWLEANAPEGLTVFDFPADHRRRLRTNNGLERLNREIKRRTRVASIFPNEASLLRLATAVLMEIDDEWQTEKTLPPQGNRATQPNPTKTIYRTTVALSPTWQTSSRMTSAICLTKSPIRWMILLSTVALKTPASAGHNRHWDRNMPFA